MASCLSEVEFERLQNQLLELRENNYALEGKCRKQEQERNQLIEQVNFLERELSKNQKIIARSKKAREVEVLIQENDILQRKLETQEEEFKLQNATLMQELTSLVTSKDGLEKELRKHSSSTASALSEEQAAELTRLRAENSAMLRSLAETQERGRLRSNTELSAKVESTEGLEIPENGEVPDLSADVQALQLKLEIEMEEKQGWKEQASAVEKKLTEEILKLREEAEKVGEKLRKKQESFQALQEEKEALYMEGRKSLENLRHTTDHQISQLSEQVSRLQSQVKSLAMERDQANENVYQLQISLATLQSQVQNLPQLEELQTEKASLEIVLQELRSELDSRQKEHQSLLSTCEEHRQSLAQLQQQHEILTKEKEEAQTAATEANKVAEKRKQLLDEMAIKLQERVEEHQRVVGGLAEQHSTQVQALQLQLQEIKGQVQELEQCRGTIMALSRQLEQKQAVEADLADLQRRLESRQVDWEREMERAEGEWTLARRDLEHRVEEAGTARTTLEGQVTRLRQELQDMLEERKIQDKRGLAMVKELRKQLQGERRLNEKLQEKIQELLNSGSPSHTAPPSSGMEELLPSPTASQPADASSISSWSFMSGCNNHVDHARAPSDTSSVTDPVQSPLEQETSQLLARLAQVQQEKWVLEEKLDHLETSNAAMAHDLMEKSAIIQFYCMESNKPTDVPSSHHHHHQAEKPTMKRLVEFVKSTGVGSPGEDSVRDMNKRLQRMLEETLTKNMHLQKDLERLSLELAATKNKS